MVYIYIYIYRHTFLISLIWRTDKSDEKYDKNTKLKIQTFISLLSNTKGRAGGRGNLCCKSNLKEKTGYNVEGMLPND
jgi:hypothetical protein